MAKSSEERDLWITFAHEAMSKYEIPDEKLDNDDLVDDMIEVVTQYADAMLDELDERYGGSRKTPRRRRKEEEEDEDED